MCFLFLEHHADFETRYKLRRHSWTLFIVSSRPCESVARKVRLMLGELRAKEYVASTVPKTASLNLCLIVPTASRWSTVPLTRVD